MVILRFSFGIQYKKNANEITKRLSTELLLISIINNTPTLMKCLEGQTTEFDSTAQGRQRFDN